LDGEPEVKLIIRSLMRYWKKLSRSQITERILNALEQNVNYRERTVLGIPVSRLDQKVFNDN